MKIIRLQKILKLMLHCLETQIGIFLNVAASMVAVTEAVLLLMEMTNHAGKHWISVTKFHIISKLLDDL